MKGEHDDSLPRFVRLSDAAFTLILQISISYHLLAHYYGLDYNTNGGAFHKRMSLGQATWETDYDANLPEGDVYQWKGTLLKGAEDLDIKINGINTVTLTWPEDADSTSAKGSLKALAPKSKIRVATTPVKSSHIYQTSVNQAKALLNPAISLNPAIMLTPADPQSSSPLTKELTIDSLAKVSDDKAELLAPPGELSAVITEMQAKQAELIYQASTKITVLNVCAERLDSTVLCQAVSASNALNQTKKILDWLKMQTEALTNHPLLRMVLISEGATTPNMKNGELFKLNLPLNPASTTVSHLFQSLSKKATKINKWRVDFKNILKQTAWTQEIVTKELNSFLASKAHLLTHGLTDIKVMEGFWTWITEDNNKIRELDDDFQAWEQGIQDMSSFSLTSDEKALSEHSLRGIHHKKRIVIT